MEIMSVFLSHSSKDKPFARSLREELGRRGIIAWLDEVDLRLGGNRLSEQLSEQIAKQTALVLLWTEASATSPWVNEEIESAIEQDGPKNLIVIASDIAKAKTWFLGNQKLKALFAHPNDATRLDRLIHKCTELNDFDEKDSHARVIKAAQIITKAVFKLANIASASNVGLWIDQRGSGEKAESPHIDPEINGPVLVFRPNAESRKEKSMVALQEWDLVKTSMHESMAEAGLCSRSKVIHVGGAAQLAIFGSIGHGLERAKGTICCRNFSDSETFRVRTNQDWSHYKEPNFFDDLVSPFDPESNPDANDLAIIIAISGSFLESAKRHAMGKRPSYVIFTHGFISDDDTVRRLVAGIVQFLQQRSPKPKVYLYTTLPQEAVCLLFRYLRPAIISSLVFCEWVAGVDNRYDEYPIF